MSAWLSFGVALLALVQMWVIAVWRRVFRKGSVDVVENGRIELGFSALGPTVALSGTLAAIHRDQFVETFSALVTRARDGATYSFRWEVSRSGPVGAVALELPAAFMVRTSEPRRYHIVFVDAATGGEVASILAPVRQAWTQLLLAEEPPPGDQAAVEALYAQFMNEPVHVQAHADLQRALYWNSGEYTLKVSVHTSRPKVIYPRTWSFSLTNDDLASLRLNAIPALRETCGLPRQYNFVFAEYRAPMAQ
jgi:hypothetical protein